MKCRKSDLIYPNPCHPLYIQDHYGTPPEEYWRKAILNGSRNIFLYQIKVLQELRPFKAGMTALDIAAGLGKCMLSLKQAGYDAYGFEPSGISIKSPL